MRLGCLFGRHDRVPTGRVMAPPPNWTELPRFEWWRCRHCPATDYDMVWPDGRKT
jgi:hypothetical protein